MVLIPRFQRVLSERLREKKPLLQILIGPRQVGKTTAAQAIFDGWTGPKIMVSADSPSPPQPEWIAHHWEQARLKGEGCLLIIDEIQKIPGWSEQVKIMFDPDRGKRDLRILLMGSSSLYLQRGLTESLAGRFELIRAPHWSCQDFQEAFGWDFEEYLRYGAYPGAIQFKQDETRWRSYILNSVIEPVLSKDILGLNPVNNPALFRQTFELVVQYPAQVVSFNKLLGRLQDRGNASTVKHYLNLLEQSFLIRTLQKFSSSLIQVRTSSPKIIVLDQALTHAYQTQTRLDSDPDWRGRVFESIVGAHLARIENCELFYWREGNEEVDFVVKSHKGILALEIKSGPRKGFSRGLYKFSKQYPKARCETWNYERALDFLQKGDLEL